MEKFRVLSEILRISVLLSLQFSLSDSGCVNLSLCSDGFSKFFLESFELGRDILRGDENFEIRSVEICGISVRRPW